MREKKISLMIVLIRVDQRTRTGRKISIKIYFREWLAQL